MLYKSSKGDLEIATMPLRYANNALAKLRRDEPARAAEIEALEAHVASLELGGDEPNPRAVVGDNNPPAEAPADPKWDTVKIHMDDLLTEARNWADGAAINNQDQADSVGKLRQLLQDAANLADATRIAEKAPLDKQIAEIQDRYNAYIAPMKNKAPGSVSKAVTALGTLISGWLNKLDAEKKEREDAARKIAEDAAAKALEAHKAAATSTDLDAIDEATALLDAADDAAKALRSVEREKVQVKGEFRAIGLRSYWRAELIDGQGGVALKHYAQTHPERVKAFLQSLADEDVGNGARAIPGFNVIEDKRV
jgi:hypothetical protein